MRAFTRPFTIMGFSLSDIGDFVSDVGHAIGDAIDDAVDIIEEVGEDLYDELEEAYDGLEDGLRYVGEALFGNPVYKYSGTAAMQLRTDIPTTLQDAITSNAVLPTGYRDVSQAIVGANLYNNYTQARNFYNYARRSYVNGLPSSTILDKQVDTDALTAILSTKYGGSITLLKSNVGTPSAYYWAYKHMLENQGWNPETNLIEDATFKDKSGSTITGSVTFHSAAWADLSDASLIIVYSYSDGGQDKLLINVYDIDEPDPDHTYYTALARSFFEPTHDPVNTNFSPTQIEEKVAAVRESHTTLVYPEVEEEETPVDEGTEEPTEPPEPIEVLDEDAADTEIIQWCLDNTIYPIQLGYALGETESSWLDRAVELGIDGFIPEQGYSEYNAFIYDIADGTYPTLSTAADIADGSKFFPVIPIMQEGSWVNNDKESALYITGNRALSKMDMSIDEVTSSIDEDSGNEDIDKLVDAFVTMAIHIDTESDEGITYLTDFFHDLAGTSTKTSSDWNAFLNKDPEDQYASAVPNNYFLVTEDNFNLMLVYHYIDTDLVDGVIGDVGTATRTMHEENPRNFGGVSTDDDGATPTFSVDVSYVIFRKQVTATQYREVKVFGLSHTSAVHNGTLAYVTLQDVANEDVTDAFYIPLNIDIVKTYKVKARDILCAEALTLVAYAYQQEVGKWYETALFIAILQIVIIVVSIVLMQPQLVALAGAASILAAAWIVAKLVLYNYVIDLAVQEIVDLLGPEWALIVAAIAAGLGAAGGTNLLGMLPSAEVLLGISTQIAGGVQQATADEVNDIAKELEGLTDDYTEQMEALTELEEDLLASNDAVRSLLRTTAMEALDVDPSTYYYRAIHKGNIGTTTLDTVKYYVEAALELPSTSTTT